MSQEQDSNESITKAVENFGGLLREFRLHHHLSLQDTAEIIGCSSSYVFRVEQKKRNPSIEFRMKVLTEAMNWSTDSLYMYLGKVISEERNSKEQ